MLARHLNHVPTYEAVDLKHLKTNCEMHKLDYEKNVNMRF